MILVTCVYCKNKKWSSCSLLEKNTHVKSTLKCIVLCDIRVYWNIFSALKGPDMTNINNSNEKTIALLKTQKDINNVAGANMFVSAQPFRNIRRLCNTTTQKQTHKIVKIYFLDLND